jgi:hypothetical protein
MLCLAQCHLSRPPDSDTPVVTNRVRPRQENLLDSLFRKKTVTILYDSHLLQWQKKFWGGDTSGGERKKRRWNGCDIWDWVVPR